MARFAPGIVSQPAVRWPTIMGVLVARTCFALIAQGVTVGSLAFAGSADPWKESLSWLPVYGTLIDLACLALIARLLRHEGKQLRDLVGFDRGRLPRDILLGLAIIPVSLAIIFASTSVVGRLVYDSAAEPFSFGPLPLWAALYGVLVWPFVWGFTEQLTYNGYLLPRIWMLSGRTFTAAALVAVAWAFQHVVMPLQLDGHYFAFRLLSSLPHSVFLVLVYLRIRRLVPLMVAHALLDGASVAMSVLLPALQG